MSYVLTNFSDFIPSTVPISFDIGTINNGMVSGTQGTFLITTYLTESSVDYIVDQFSSTTII